MGRSNRHTCPKCGAKDSMVRVVPKWSPGYKDQPHAYYDEYGSPFRSVLSEHLRIECNECNWKWTQPCVRAKKARRKEKR